MDRRVSIVDGSVVCGRVSGQVGPPALAPLPKMFTVYIQTSQTTVHTTQCIVYSCCYPSANYYLLTRSTVQSTVGCSKMFDGNF